MVVSSGAFPVGSGDGFVYTVVSVRVVCLLLTKVVQMLMNGEGEFHSWPWAHVTGLNPETIWHVPLF